MTSPLNQHESTFESGDDHVTEGLIMSDVEDIFVKAGAVLKGHFLLASGLHSPVYWEKFRVLQFPTCTEQLCGMIADHFRGEGIQMVAGPTTGGVILAFEVARQLGTRAIYAERTESEGRTFRRGQNISPGERVLVVDDVITAGGSVQDVIDAVSALDGKVVGIGVLVDRTRQPIDFGVPLYSCLRTVAETYTPENCPQCAAGEPLVKPGSGQA
jgi:orotate phosphoribosyltransferase